MTKIMYCKKDINTCTRKIDLIDKINSVKQKKSMTLDGSNTNSDITYHAASCPKHVI